jgi:hypothetical protein
MVRKIRVLLYVIILLALPAFGVQPQIKPQPHSPPNVALVNGRWFNGESFVARDVYSVNGRFTFKRPARLDRSLDLAGTWVVPPFGEAHNHNLGTGVDEWDRKAIQKYLADGVFYVKIQGNLPLSDEAKHGLLINRRESVDAVFAQGSLTGTGGHPIRLVETVLLPRGYYPGFTKETLKDYRYFTIDSEAELDKKWSRIVGQRPDFIKTFLLFSDEFEKRRDDPVYFGRKGLDPRLLPKIVAKAHASNLRVSAHVNNAADFHHAVAAGVDEVAHLPVRDPRPQGDGPKSAPLISVADAKLAAARGIVVVTTASLVLNAPEAERAPVRQLQAANLKLLREHGVVLAVGSDNPNDSSVQEFEYLQGMGVFDNLTLLKMWAETTPKTIFPKRKIGALREGYEASFLALEGDPLKDLKNVRKIRVRFRQGFLLEL